MIILVGGS